MDATASRLLVALASLVLNLGARHLPGGLSPRMQMLTTSRSMRMLVVCAMFYLSTRDVMLSVALAFMFFMVVSTLLNEHSGYSVIDGLRGSPITMTMPMPKPMHMPVPVQIPISREMYDDAVATVLAFRRQIR